MAENTSVDTFKNIETAELVAMYEARSRQLITQEVEASLKAYIVNLFTEDIKAKRVDPLLVMAMFKFLDALHTTEDIFNLVEIHAKTVPSYMTLLDRIHAFQKKNFEQFVQDTYASLSKKDDPLAAKFLSDSNILDKEAFLEKYKSLTSSNE